MLVGTRCRLALLRVSTVKFKTRWRNQSDLSYVHKLGNEPLRAITLGCLLEDAASKYRDRPCVISRHQKKTVSFGELLEQADRFAAALTTLGLERGARVGLCLPNRYEWLVAMYACIRADLILVALNPAYQAPELEYCINKVEMSALICTDNFKTQNYYEILKSICPEINNAEPGKIQSKNIPSLRHAIFITEDSFKGAHNYEELMNLSNENNVKKIKNNQHLIQSEDPTIIQFSSGTTGKPKASISSHFNMVNNSYEIGKRMELNKKHHILCLPNPLFHAYGLAINTFSALNFGATFVLPDQGYNPNKTLDAIIEEKCTFLHGTPTMHVDLMDVQLKRKENISIEIAVSGGAPCSPQVFKNMKEILNIKKVKSVYGLSETTAVVFHSAPNDDDQQAVSTVGLLGDHLEAKIVDADGRIVPFGQPGELYIRGYANMLGYWKDEEKTNEIYGLDGWLKTGDQFVLERNGYGKVVGRLKDMIIRGGENIFPKEIEDFLNTHPDILETQIVGAPNERLGEEVYAFIRLKDGRTLDREALVAFCKGKIAHFKIPSRIQIVDNFPRTTSGKIQKFKLKELINT